MKKSILALVLLVLTSPTFAATFEVIGPCSATAVFESSVTLAAPVSVGSFTLNLLEANQLEYIGTEHGISSILGTPVGTDAVEALTSTEARFYGWCYQVDGQEPAVMPNEFILNGPEHVRWFYAFSHLKEDQWLSYCEPAHTVKPAMLCDGLK